jgi:hypothetical protein
MCPSEETIVLWHSTSLSNKDLILKNGITCFPLTKSEAKQKLKTFHDTVSMKLGVKFRNKHYTLDRILQASEKGNVVYLSDEKEYSMQNALASQEWKINVIHAALEKKFPEEYKESEYLRDCYCRASARWRRHNEFMRRYTPKNEFERKEINKENMRLYDLRSEASNRFSDYERVCDIEREYERLFFSTKCVVFKIELPWSVFLSLYKDSQQKLERKDFHEVCLTNVSSEYIVSFEEFNMEGR